MTWTTLVPGIPLIVLGDIGVLKSLTVTKIQLNVVIAARFIQYSQTEAPSLFLNEDE